MSISGNWEKRRMGPTGSLGEVDRRKFLALSSAGAAALILGYGPFTEKTWAQPYFSDNPFSLGVASGDPLPDGVVLWTRLAPDPLNGGGMRGRKVPVQWQVATDESFGDIVREGSEFARPELAHSVHVEVTGLNSASEYFYRFRACPELSPVGRTRTAPAATCGLSGSPWSSSAARTSPKAITLPTRTSCSATSTSCYTSVTTSTRVVTAAELCGATPASRRR